MGNINTLNMDEVVRNLHEKLIFSKFLSQTQF